MHIEDSIKKSLQWTVFEPNTEDLRSKIKKMITAYLSELFHYGAVVGSNPQEAFFVTIDRTTMTDDDIINGKLICEIGIAPLRPAEFVIFKIELKTAEALY
jgi:phage tail sheath protein FI